MKLIESYVYNGEGYNPSLVNKGWQVAYLNYAPSESLEEIDRLDIHFETDEVFVLLEGTAVLIAADFSQGNAHYDTVFMQPGVIYNIPCKTWHQIALYPGSRICIVEKDNTHVSDFEYYNLTPEQKKQLVDEVERCRFMHLHS